MVPRRGLEPPHPKAHGPEPCASTNSAIWATIQALQYRLDEERKFYRKEILCQRKITEPKQAVKALKAVLSLQNQYVPTQLRQKQVHLVCQ